MTLGYNGKSAVKKTASSPFAAKTSEETRFEKTKTTVKLYEPSTPMSTPDSGRFRKEIREALRRGRAGGAAEGDAKPVLRDRAFAGKAADAESFYRISIAVAKGATKKRRSVGVVPPVAKACQLAATSAGIAELPSMKVTTRAIDEDIVPNSRVAFIVR